MTPQIPAELAAFIHETRHVDLPAEVAHQTRRCMLDLVGVAVAGSATPLSRIVRDHAHRQAPGSGQSPRLLFDGRRVGAASAAMANAATIDSMDGHDGHRLAKGHAGVAVLPAALAFLDDGEEHSMQDLLTAVAVGYEIGLRAGLTLHATATDYHSSGAWNALAAATVGARLLGLGAEATWHALGIAEASAPRAPMMRTIDHPTMVKDSSMWGAQAGVSAALLAEDGFTGAPAELVKGREEWADLGDRWHMLEQYFKPHPVCRWALPAVQAVLSLMHRTEVTSDQIGHVEVATFEAGTRLATRAPATTEEAQYSLPYAVAASVVHGELTPEMLLNPPADPEVRRLAESLVVTECAHMTRQFPATRWAEVTIVLRDGRRHSSGPTVAEGDPESSLSDAQLLSKFELYAQSLGRSRTDLLANTLLAARDDSVTELLGLLSDRVGSD